MPKSNNPSQYWRDLLTQHLVDQQPISTDDLDLIVAFHVAKREDFTERLPEQWWHNGHPAFPEGWTAEDKAEVEGRHAGEMCLTVAETGNKICFPTHLTPCDHIRVLDSEGKEVAYWDEREWAEDPALVMGAIMGALCNMEISDSREVSKDFSELAIDVLRDSYIKVSLAAGQDEAKRRLLLVCDEDAADIVIEGITPERGANRGVSHEMTEEEYRRCQGEQEDGT